MTSKELTILALKNVNCYGCSRMYSRKSYYDSEKDCFRRVIKCSIDDQWIKEPQDHFCICYEAK